MSIDKPTMWFFGDSYTRGVSSTKLESLIKSKKQGYKIWPEILSEKLGYNMENHAIGGNSNDGIFNNFIENLPHIGFGDIVIISDTSPLRIMGINPTKKGEEYITLNNYIEDGKVKLDFDTAPIDKKDSKYLTNYIYDFYYKYENIWSRHFYENIVDIRKYLAEYHVEVYFWSYRLWNDTTRLTQFSKIVDESNGDIKDSHWGIEGNRQFADFMKRQISKKFYDTFY